MGVHRTVFVDVNKSIYFFIKKLMCSKLYVTKNDLIWDKKSYLKIEN